MDKSVLTEYADEKEEIKDLRRRIEEDSRTIDKLNNMIIVDSTTCGKKGEKPIKTVRVRGIPENSIRRKKKALERKIALMEKLTEELLEKQTQVEEYIQKIKKSRTREIFRLYYIEGMNWEMTAAKMNYMFPKKRNPFTGDSCRMEHNRLLAKGINKCMPPLEEHILLQKENQGHPYIEYTSYHKGGVVSEEK